ncbi:hypothetical protein CCUS01_14578 [Colletotrichum cuscutae]|uniref:Uncharacterized protein n=1 Tax=Colletotrichum cuscutae TaxID=1209917 RepID=A0AAI9Y8S8_9PEZI|nr:hypothetical protein CCUS01_14578 [Colletotrichum cuscutae]
MSSDKRLQGIPKGDHANELGSPDRYGAQSGPSLFARKCCVCVCGSVGKWEEVERGPVTVSPCAMSHLVFAWQWQPSLPSSRCWPAVLLLEWQGGLIDSLFLLVWRNSTTTRRH